MTILTRSLKASFSKMSLDFITRVMFSLPDKYKTNKKFFVQCDMIRCELRVESYELRVAIRTTSLVVGEI